MKQFTVLLCLLTLAFGQNISASQYLSYYAKKYQIEFNQTSLSTDKKDEMIFNAYVSGDYEKIHPLIFTEADTSLSYVNLWIDALYRLEAYELIVHFFSDTFPTHELVLSSLFKLQEYERCIDHLYKLNQYSTRHLLLLTRSLFYSSKFQELVNLNIPEGFSEQHKTMYRLKFVSLFYLKEFEQAVEIGKRFNSSDFSAYPDNLLRLAMCYMSLNQFDVAEILFKKYEEQFLAEAMPKYQRALFLRGYMKQESSDFKEMNKYYKNVLELNPYSDISRGVHKNLASYYEENKVYSKAISHWEKYAELLEKAEKGRHSNTLERIARLKEKLFLHSDTFR